MSHYFMISRSYCIIAILPTLIAISAHTALAFAPEDLAVLKATKKCSGCDLRSADLSGTNLEGAEMEGINFMGANLEGTNLKSAIMDDASLENANLKNALLGGASLDHAVIDGADLTGANCEEAIWTDGRTCKKGSVGGCK